MKRFIKLITTSILTLSLVACSNNQATTDNEQPGGKPAVLSIIATANPHEIILNEVAPILLEEYNIKLDITVTDDYYIPNELVSNGEVDVNFFQHVPFFSNEKETNNYAISNILGVHIEPFGFYSKRISNIEDLPDNATIVVSNSVADNGRILSILQKAGILTLNDGVDAITATLNDIKDNPKNLQFVEVKPELLYTAYEEDQGDLVAINGNYAIQGGLKPAQDAVLLEQADQDNPYVNIIVCQEGKENDERIQALVEVLKSDAIKEFIKNNWSDGSVIPAN